MDSPNRSEPGTLSILWRRAPLWRATLIGASLVTLAAAGLWAEFSQRQSVTAAPAAASLLNDVTLLNTPAAAGPIADEEEQVLATCHPHLLHTPATMPQIDLAGVSEPGLGHTKMHLWVNGAGVVTRHVVTATTLGTPAERQAEEAYSQGLTFSLPNTKECRSREVEVIGDFFEQRNGQGRWETYLRLYPRLNFSNTGTLERRD